MQEEKAARRQKTEVAEQKATIEEKIADRKRSEQKKEHQGEEKMRVGEDHERYDEVRALEIEKQKQAKIEHELKKSLDNARMNWKNKEQGKLKLSEKQQQQSEKKMQEETKQEKLTAEQQKEEKDERRLAEVRQKAKHRLQEEEKVKRVQITPKSGATPWRRQGGRSERKGEVEKAGRGRREVEKADRGRRLDVIPERTKGRVPDRDEGKAGG